MKRKARKHTKVSVGEVWSDLDHKFIKDSVGGIKKAVNVEAVYTSIDNILRTHKGERVMLPSFASDIHGLMFEPLTSTTVSFITRILKDTIEAWDDRVTIEEVSISRDPDRNGLDIGFIFMIRGYEDTFQYETQLRGKY